MTARFSVSLAGQEQMAVTALLAIAAHVVFANREPSLWSIVFLYLAAWTGWTTFLVRERHVAVLHAIATTAQLSTVFTVTLLLSIGVYRRFLHRLCRFKGPTSLILSKWAWVPTDAAGERPVRLAKLHAQYGDVVRIGPRELSINDPNAIPAVLGGSSKCLKGPWYTSVHGGKGPRSFNLHVTINPAERRARRRMWDQAFSVRALSSYEDQLRTKTHEVMQQLHASANKNDKDALALDQWCMLYSFDVMGTLGFSRNFDMVGAGKFSNEIELLESFMSAVMVLGNVPYMAHLARVLPNPLQAFDDYTEQALVERVERQKKNNAEGKQGADVADIFAHLLAKEDDGGNKASWQHTWKELAADASLIVVAGSDTSSSVLSLALFSLATNQECFTQLRNELQSKFGANIDPDLIDDFDALAKDCPYLNAVINETMRLYPPVASGVQRVTPASGAEVVIGMRDKTSVVLPADTVVSIPTSIIQRDPRNYSPKPNAFRPERWIWPDKEQAFEQKAFIPFGYGPSGCVGKALALMEMRIFLAQFVLRFDIDLPASFDKQAFLDGIKDTFTMTRHTPLHVQLRPRAKA